MKENELSPLQQKVSKVLFGINTRSGRAFEVLLSIIILISVLGVMLETVEQIQIRYGKLLYILDWTVTIVFTIEYGLRIYSIKKPEKYITSFFGIVDLLSILPTYLGLFFVGTHYLSVIRALRLLRVFRIFKLGRFMKEGKIIIDALRVSQPKIMVFLFFVVIVVVIIGSLMYLIEGGQNSDFSSIPLSIYWAIVTLTTVGYGDITPHTELGQFVSALVMILGYVVIAVPTGIVANDIINTEKDNLPKTKEKCGKCTRMGHEEDAICCKYCGETLTSKRSLQMSYQ